MLFSRTLRNLVITITLLTAVCGVAQQNLKLGGRSIFIDNNGDIAVKQDEKPAYKLMLACFIPTWRQITSAKAFDLKQEKGDDTITVSGKFPYAGDKAKAAAFEEKISWTEQQLTVVYTMTVPAAYTLMKKTHPYVILELPADLARNTPVKLGKYDFTLPVHNKHAWSNKVELPAEGVSFKAATKASQSIWTSKATGTVAVRMGLTGKKSDDGSTVYKQIMTILFK